MSESSSVAARRAITARNAGAILDGAQRLLTKGQSLNFSAVADEAGVSRPTVYAHFGNRQLLLGALVERSVQQVLAAIEDAQPHRGPAPEALHRLAVAGWEHLARHLEIARAAASQMPADAFHAHHHEALKTIERLVRRGQREGTFRRDLPVGWLATSCVALMHSAALAVSSGQMDPDQAERVLPTTLVDLCVGPRATTRAARRR